MICATPRNRRGKLYILFRARTENGRALVRSDAGRFHVRRKITQLFSFRLTPAKLLPPDLQRRAETDAKGNVKSTPNRQKALLKIFLRATSILRDAGKLRVFLLQLSPACLPQTSTTRTRAVGRDAARSRAGDRVPKSQLGSRRSVAIDNRFSAKALCNFGERGRARHRIISLSCRRTSTNDESRMSHTCGCMDATRKPTSPVKRWPRASITITAIRKSQKSQSAAGSWRRARELHVIFNNNNLDYAPRAALRLRKALGKSSGHRRRRRSCFRLIRLPRFPSD